MKHNLNKIRKKESKLNLMTPIRLQKNLKSRLIEILEKETLIMSKLLKIFFLVMLKGIMITL